MANYNPNVNTAKNGKPQNQPAQNPGQRDNRQKKDPKNNIPDYGDRPKQRPEIEGKETDG